MNWRVLRPVGEPLRAPSPLTSVVSAFPRGCQPFFVQSGTAALALGLLAAREKSNSSRSRVLLPAYGCPDLVAAVVYAGLEPELIDTARGEPFLDLECLENRLRDDVLAVVGVHFLGLPERIAQAREIASQHGVIVIEDSAQRIPGLGGIQPLADLVVLSFGRGKPAGALGGGALLAREGWVSENLQASIQPAAGRGIPPLLKRSAYNWLIRPRAYAVVSKVPGLGLGKTVYRPLAGIRWLDQERTVYAASQYVWAASRQRSWVEDAYAEILQGGGLAGDFLGALSLRATAPLLRYPIVCPSRTVRDALDAELAREGLGSSRMYGQTLADLPGVPHCEHSEQVQAREFADRLLTLPVHSDVKEADVSRVETVIRRHFRSA